MVTIPSEIRPFITTSATGPTGNGQPLFSTSDPTLQQGNTAVRGQELALQNRVRERNGAAPASCPVFSVVILDHPTRHPS
jgi:hypothetical protein